MQGLIANQLRRFALSRVGRDGWVQAVRAAGGGLPEEVPALGRTYPDEAIVAVVVAIAEASGTGVTEILQDFGHFLAPSLLRVYEPLVKAQWRTLDVIEHVERQIHTVVRLRDPDAGPPELKATRISDSSVEVEYTSGRRLCALAEGIVRGLGDHYGERLEIEQPECMHRGDARCLIRVDIAPAA